MDYKTRYIINKRETRNEELAQSLIHELIESGKASQITIKKWFRGAIIDVIIKYDAKVTFKI